MIDEQKTGTTQPKQEWIKPEVRRMIAGSAEGSRGWWQRRHSVRLLSLTTGDRPRARPHFRIAVPIPVPYPFRMDRPRIVISGDQLAVVIRGWLRSTPERLWGKDPNFERLKALKRHMPGDEPDPRREVADLITARLAELEWEVSYPEPTGTFQRPRWEG